MGTISHNIASSLEKGSWIRKLFDEGARLKGLYGDDAVFDFSLGNPIVEPPAAFGRALQEVLQQDVKGKHQYIANQGLADTRAKVAGFINERFQTEITAATVVMTVGAGGALNVVLKSILEPGEEVVVLTPYFVEYDFYVANHGGVSVHCPLAEDFSLDFAQLEQAITAKTKAIIVNTPHNPTGTLLTQAQLNGLGALLGEKERQFGSTIYMVYDDPYSQLVYESVPPNPFEAYGRTILASSFSKDLGIAGERIGYVAVEPSVEDSQLLTSAIVFCNRTLGFVNAPVTMQRVIARMDSLVTPQLEYKERRDLMVDVLRDAGFSFIVPQGGFFIFPKAPVADDVAFCLKVAQDFRLLLVPGSGFGRGGHFRLSYSVPLQQIERSRDVFKQVMAAYQ